MPLAVAALVRSTKPDARSDGTAFALDGGLGLTAWHLVEDTKRVLLRFSGGEVVPAEVKDRDPQLDVVTLRLTKALPADYEPIRLGGGGRALDQLRCLVRGYPHDRPAAGDPLVAGGEVRDADARLDGLPAVQLFLQEVAEGIEPGGFSGAPVLARASGWEEQRAIGVVHWGKPRPDGGAGHGGVVYAAAIERLADRGIARLLAAGREVLPAAGAIRAFERQYRGPFAGRDAELARLDTWLAGEDEPYMLVTGPAGRGKSALLVAWNERLSNRDDVDAILLPISVRFGVNTEVTILRALLARLATLRGEAIPTLSSAEGLREAIAERLSRPLPGDRRLAIVVDGLDEAAEQLAWPELFSLEPAPGVRILTSARLTAGHPNPADWLAELGWDDDAQALELGTLDLAGIAAVLAASGEELEAIAADPAAPGALHALTEGDPLVLSLTLDDAARRAREGKPLTVADLAAQPQGRAARLKRWWRDQEELWGQSLADQGADVKTVLNLLAAALGPLERRHLRALAGAGEAWPGERLNAALNPLERLVAHDPAADTYAMGHPLLAEDRVEQLERDDELKPLDDRFVEKGLSALHTARRSGHYEEIPGYTVRHLGEHLARSEAEVDTWMELAGPAWRTAWEARTEEFEGHLRDVRLAERAALADSDAALAAGRSPQHLADALACALERAAAAELRERVPPELAAELVRYGLWSGARALGLAARLPSADDRAAALAALALHLDPTDTLAAAGLLELQGDAWALRYAAAASALGIQMLAVGMTARAFELADSAPGLARGLSLAALAPHLEERRDDAIRTAFDQLRALEPTNLERDDLAEALAKIPVEVAAAALGTSVELAVADFAEEVASQFDSLDGFAPTFRLIASWLSERDAREQAKPIVEALLERARSDDQFEASQAARELVELAPFADPEPLLEAAERIDDLPRRDRLVLAVGECLPADRRSDLLDRVCADLPVLLSTGVVSDRTAVAGRLAALGRGSEVLETVGRLLTDDNSADGILAHAAPHLDLAQARAGVRLVGDLPHEIRDDAIGPLLTRLASFGPAEAAEALDRIALPSDSEAQLALRAVLDAAVAGRIRVEPLEAVRDPELRAVAVRTAAGLATVDGEAATAILKLLGNGPLASQAFADMYGSADEAADLALHAQWVMTAVPDGRKDRTMVGFLQRLAEEEGAEAAMGCARRAASPNFEAPLTWAVAACAQVATEVDAEWLRDRAESIADRLNRAGALAAVADRIPELRAELTERAVELLEGAEAAHPGQVAFALERLDDSARQAVLRKRLASGFHDVGASSVLRGVVLREMAGVFDRATIVRLADDLGDLGSGERGEVLAAFGQRLAILGDTAGALALIPRIGATAGAAELAAKLAAVLPVEHLGACLEVAADRLPPVTFAAARGNVFAAAGRRAQEMEPEQAWDLLRRWHARESPAGVLIDLHCYLPLMLRLGGPGTVEQVAALSALAPPGE